MQVTKTILCEKVDIEIENDVGTSLCEKDYTNLVMSATNQL